MRASYGGGPARRGRWIPATNADVARDGMVSSYRALLPLPVGSELQEWRNGRLWGLRVVSKATDPGLTTFAKDVRGWICPGAKLGVRATICTQLPPWPPWPLPPLPPCRVGPHLKSCNDIRVLSLHLAEFFGTELEAVDWLMQRAGVAPDVAVLKRMQPAPNPICGSTPFASTYDLVVKATGKVLGEITNCPCCDPGYPLPKPPVSSVLWRATLKAWPLSGPGAR